MIPVEALAVSDITHNQATFTWANPTQPSATPNATQIRIPQLSNLWVDIGYPVTEIDWGGLAPDNLYTFQVRLVEYSDGNIVDASPVRQIGFATTMSPNPIVDPDDDGVGVTIPQTPDDGCDLEWELQRTSDGVTWTTVTSGSNPPGGTLDLGGELFDPEYTYRVRSREVCGEVEGPWYVSDVFLPECTISGAYGADDYADPSLMLFVPEVCTPDVVRDAVSGNPAIHGPAWGGVQSIDTDTLALSASTAAGGTVAYGDASGLENNYGDATLGCRVSIQNAETQRLVSIPGLRIDCVPEGSGWKARAGVTTVLGDEVTVESGELPLITVADVRATYDATTGMLALIVDGTEVDSDSVEEPAQRANAGKYWYTALPAASWITNIAAWSKVLAAEPAGFNPETDMTWHSLFWAEGSAFTALGLSNGDPIGTWPNEAGESSASSSGGNRPVYVAAEGDLSGKPSVDFLGSRYLVTSAFGSNPSYPISIVMVVSDLSHDQPLIDGINSSNRNHIYESGDDFAIYAGSTRGSSRSYAGHAAIIAKFDGGTGSDVLIVEGSTVINANAGSQTLTGLAIGVNFTLGAYRHEGTIAFLGIYEGDIESDPAYADLKAWVLSHYGRVLP